MTMWENPLTLAKSNKKKNETNIYVYKIKIANFLIWQKMHKVNEGQYHKCMHTHQNVN